jgi:hypothetical protein
MNREKTILTGTVKRTVISKGSKSEHAGPTLVCGRKTYVLRRFRGPSFGDDFFEAYIGREIRAEGYVDRYVFTVVGTPELVDSSSKK